MGIFKVQCTPWKIIHKKQQHCTSCVKHGYTTNIWLTIKETNSKCTDTTRKRVNITKRKKYYSSTPKHNVTFNSNSDIENKMVNEKTINYIQKSKSTQRYTSIFILTLNRRNIRDIICASTPIQFCILANSTIPTSRGRRGA